MAYTLAEAAKACGRGKSTIHKAIQTGQLSAEKQPNGAYAIDGAELARVFPPKPRAVPEPSPWEAHGREETAGDATELAVLRERLRSRDDQLAREQEALVREQETVADLRARLDRAEARILVLSQQVPPPPATERSVEAPTAAPVAAEPTKAPRGFWGRLLGR